MNFRKIAIILAIALVPATAAAQKGKPKPSPTPTAVVTAKFTYCTAGDTDCENANRVRQEKDAPYVKGQDGVDISFNVGVSGDLTINILTSSNRRSIVDLRDRVYDGNPQPFWTASPQTVKIFYNVLQAYNAKLAATCSQDGICEGSYTTNMNAGDFTIDGIFYRLQWNPDSRYPCINWVVPTSKVNVHYYKDGAGETWTITPIQTDNGYYLAGLQGESGGGKKKLITFGGQFNMPFTLVVTVN